jgi:putative ABC transport system permease protein
MFFVTYVRRELRRRMRQAVVIALGLALGIGLVITVSAASAGVRKAQSAVLRGLYGVGTDITVTTKPPVFKPGSGGTRVQFGPGGGRVCQRGKCKSGAQTVDTLNSPGYGTLAATEVAAIARLHHVAKVAGGLSLSDTRIKIPASIGSAGGGTLPQPQTFTVNGVDLAQRGLGPLSSGTLTAGRGFTSADRNASVAVIDSNYATAHKLKTGDKITIAKKSFTVIGIVRQPQGGSPPEVYIPLARAQALASSQNGKSMKNLVNAIYVSAASAADIGVVQKEISRLLPHATVTTSASLASQVTGSLASTARLAGALGRWLSILVLIAAFAVASLLTMAAVSRRVREFGTLKALGWRSRRIVSQVLGESVAMGVIGGAVGVGLGLAGAAVITKVAPRLSATVPAPSNGPRFAAAGPGGGPVSSSGPPTANHTVLVPLHASVTVQVILLAVLLAVVGGLLAGAFGSWRISQLRPAAALARVE